MSDLTLNVHIETAAFDAECAELGQLLSELTQRFPQIADALCKSVLDFLDRSGDAFRLDRPAASHAGKPAEIFLALQFSQAFRVLIAAIRAAHREAMLPDVHNSSSPSLLGTSIVDESLSGFAPDGDNIAVSILQPSFAAPNAIYLGHLSDYELESLLFSIRRSARMQVPTQAYLKVGQFIGPSTGDVLDQRSEPVDFGPDDRIADIVQGCADHLSVNSAQKGRAIRVHGSYPGGEAGCDIQEHVTERGFVGANGHRDLPRSEGKTQDSTEASIPIRVSRLCLPARGDAVGAVRSTGSRAAPLFRTAFRLRGRNTPRRRNSDRRVPICQPAPNEVVGDNCLPAVERRDENAVRCGEHAQKHILVVVHRISVNSSLPSSAGKRCATSLSRDQDGMEGITRVQKNLAGAANE